MKALIFGCTGQDGAYLTRLLMAKGYEVHGVVRRKADPNTWRLEELNVLDGITLHTGDVTDAHSINNIFDIVEPSEVYNLAAQSFVAASFDAPASTFSINAVGTLNILEAIRTRHKDCRMYQASTSEMFGLVDVDAQDENTKFHPRSPYGVAKLAAHFLVKNYRETYGVHASCGILFNHESPLRGIEFVTRKVTDGVAQIIAGKTNYLALGNVEAVRDWGHAEDFVRAMWAMLQKPEPDDFVIATGESHTVREMCDIAFNYVGLNYLDYVTEDPAFYRPCEVPLLLGNASKARAVLMWEPSHSFDRMIADMVDADLKRHGTCQEVYYAADDR